MVDVLIIGGGPAGLSAALLLGRSRRHVVLVDSGEPRNSGAASMHGFLTRDGIEPGAFRSLAREQFAKYPDVTLVDGEVTSVERRDNGFTATLKDRTTILSRVVLFATGIVDEKPKVHRLSEFWGKSVHLCPYCDGWEYRDKPIAIYGSGKDGVEFALELRGWSRDLVLCTDGPSELAPKERDRLQKAGIPIIQHKIHTLEGTAGKLTGIRFASGLVHPCHALFVTTHQHQRTDLARELGCKVSEDGTTLDCTECASTNIPGIYVAGNTSRGLQLAIIAAAEGTQAAFTINQALLEADSLRP